MALEFGYSDALCTLESIVSVIVFPAKRAPPLAKEVVELFVLKVYYIF